MSTTRTCYPVRWKLILRDPVQSESRATNPAFNLALNKEWSSIITPLQIETQGTTLESHLGRRAGVP